MPDIRTADLYDRYADKLQVVSPGFTHYGGKISFHGKARTLKVHEDNTLVRQALEQPGHGCVLVVDGGGSLRCALVGDNLARLAIDQGWAGIVVNGCIRDSQEIGAMDIGIKALGTNPAKSVKRGEGQEDVAVQFAGVRFDPGCQVYSDADGIVVSDDPLACE